ncbi:MAG: outer membrane beta-barrel protein [Terriglobia bacterium]
MRKLGFLAGLLIALALPAAAQEPVEFPTVELFSGFSYANLDFDLKRRNFVGFQGNLSVNLYENLGITGDVGGQFKSLPGLSIQTWEFLIGPRAAVRGNRLTVFGHALFGAMHTRIRQIGSATDFAMGFGGGADVNLSKNLALRVLQVDYIPVSSGGIWLHNLRFGFGIVIKAGGGY